MRINCAGESGIVYRILIVDDEKIERTGLRLLLGKMDQKFEITEAVNGKEALEWLSCNRADILVTDIRMPFMDGLELSRMVKAELPDIKYYVAGVIEEGYVDVLETFPNWKNVDF